MYPELRTHIVNADNIRKFTDISHFWNKGTWRLLVEAKRHCRSMYDWEDEILNYFVNRSTNASAESLNAKIKEFWAQLRGVIDKKFFIFRLVKIFG